VNVIDNSLKTLKNRALTQKTCSHTRRLTDGDGELDKSVN